MCSICDASPDSPGGRPLRDSTQRRAATCWSRISDIKRWAALFADDPCSSSSTEQCLVAWLWQKRRNDDTSQCLKFEALFLLKLLQVCNSDRCNTQTIPCMNYRGPLLHCLLRDGWAAIKSQRPRSRAKFQDLGGGGFWSSDNGSS